jgi:hypothetical protein
MTLKLISDNRLDFKGVSLGPRLQHDIARRIRELEARLPLSMTKSDWRELTRLRQLLQLMKTGGDYHDI